MARTSTPVIAFRFHPPERRRAPASVAACACCCCSCCLHSIGGLIGSTAAGRSKTHEDFKATITYWLCLLVSLVVAGAWSSIENRDGTEALLIVALLLPAVQIAASVVAAVIVLLIAPTSLRRIGRITWRGFLGALMGLGVMLMFAAGARGSLGYLLLILLGMAVVFALFRSSIKKAAAQQV